MSFDISRSSFDPTKDYLGVVMQQGRVQLDSDWNEWQAEFMRRIQAGTLDILGTRKTFGRAICPRTTPNGFGIGLTADGAGMTIGAGRVYVDGIMVENHGVLPPAFTVVATNNLQNPGACQIQIAQASNGQTDQFNFTRIQPSENTQPTTPLQNQTVSSIVSALGSNSTLASLIQIQDVQDAASPPILVSSGTYPLAAVGDGYQAIIPSQQMLQWDPALAEMSGASQAPSATPVAIDYTQQPYLPNAVFPALDGLALVYLDVWRRPVTFLEDPSLVEKAVGVDTTGRLQTVWQVKLLKLSSTDASMNCLSDIPEWHDLIQPPAGWLTNGVVQSAPPGPCCLNPNTGYTGQENQLYRVEIHQSGAPLTSLPVPSSLNGIATFKWSRDNNSVATSVSAIATNQSSSTLTVASLGRDRVLGFNPNDWIEITDDYMELNSRTSTDPSNSPPMPRGELHQIASVPPSTDTIILADTVTNFPPNGQTNPARHTRICRWDQPASQTGNQSGIVYLRDGQTQYCNLNDTGGSIPVPPPGTVLLLENGITVQFGGGNFNAGDYWVFAARATDGSIESLIQAPPKGIYHHYARLALIDFSSPPGQPTDCRIPWPPSPGGCCTISITPEEFAADPDILQNACNWFAQSESIGTICLEAGYYSLKKPLLITDNHSELTIESCKGTATLMADPSSMSAFENGLIQLSADKRLTIPLTLKGLQLDLPVTEGPSGSHLMIGVRVETVNNLTIRDCVFDYSRVINPPRPLLAAGIFVVGQCTNLTIQGNEFNGFGATMESTVLTGLLVPSYSERVGALDNVVIRDNSFSALTLAIFSSAKTGTMKLRDNTIIGCFGGVWLEAVLKVSNMQAYLQQAVADGAFFDVIALALTRLASLIPVANGPSLSSSVHVTNNQIYAIPTNSPSSTVTVSILSGFALLVLCPGQITNSTVLVSANEFRANWPLEVVRLSNLAWNSVTGNVIINVYPPPDATQKIPLSLGIFPATAAMAATGNVLNCRSNLGPGFPNRTDIQAIDPTSPQFEQECQQLNTWKFANSEPLPPP